MKRECKNSDALSGYDENRDKVERDFFGEAVLDKFSATHKDNIESDGQKNINKNEVKRKKLVALISGGGSNMQAVFDAVKSGEICGDIVAVISSNHEAGGLSRAKEQGVPAFVCALKDYGNHEARDKAILKIAEDFNADYLLLLGYLGICTGVLVSAYPNKIINIHPALLPKFGGKGFFGINVHKAVLAAGERESGATVHFVDEGTDTGEIILKKTVPVLDGDTPETLQKRVLEAEHILIVDALKKILN